MRMPCWPFTIEIIVSEYLHSPTGRCPQYTCFILLCPNRDMNPWSLDLSFREPCGSRLLRSTFTSTLASGETYFRLWMKNHRNRKKRIIRPEKRINREIPSEHFLPRPKLNCSWSKWKLRHSGGDQACNPAVPGLNLRGGKSNKDPIL